MEVYHLGSTKYADQLTGEGAKLHGGRWNLIGQPCIYTSESKALSILEYAANVSFDEMPANLSITVYQIPDEGIRVFKLHELPAEWDKIPASNAVKDWGTQQLKANKVLALRVPSVIVPSEYNYVMNPLHPDFKKVKIKEVVSFTFDGRIKK